MSGRRIAAAFAVEFGQTFRRPLFIALAVMLALTAWGLSSGHMQISSGDSSVGGTKAWITSEFAQTQTMSFLVLLYYAFFVAAAAGLSLLRDRETRVDVLLHSTPMTPGEYVWGRFFAVVASFTVLLAWQAGMGAFFNHVVPNPEAADMRGPFSMLSYGLPVLTMGLPFVIFFAGVSMWIGERTRSSVMVFVVPVLVLIASGFFLWTWSPSWLSWRLNQFLQVIEPTGYRWLNETYLKVDRGVEFYNQARVPYVGLFWVNRLWLILVGLAGVLMTRQLVAGSMRGAVERPRWFRRTDRAVRPPEGLAPESGSVLALGMTARDPGFLGTVRRVASAELHELRRQAGLYVFIPLILIQCLGNALVAVGAFDTPVLLTPGTTAAAVANQIVTFVCLLLMFYTVESLERERTTGLAPILFASPIRTTAYLTGKAVANSVVALAVLGAALIACAIAILIQGTVPFSLSPYLLVWGLLLVPTFLAWTAFVTAVYAAVGNRYGAYALAFGVLAFSGFRAMIGKMNWAGNWPLWDAVRWSDLGFFETDGRALLLNRIMVLGFALFFTVLAVRLFGRRGPDAVRTMHRLAPSRLFRSGLRMAPFAVVPVVACIALGLMVRSGLEGSVAEKEAKDYWAKNLKTWLGAPLPDIAAVDLEVELEPSRHWIASRGTFTLVNGLDSTLTRFPVTTGIFWENLEWTMDGAPCTPEDSEHLFVFEPARALAPGDSVVIGWSFDGRFPGGVTRNGGNTSEFILPSGVVLTGFSPSFAPVLGFQEDIGETEDNRTEPKTWPRDYWKGVTRGGYGATSWYRARISVTGPAEYTLNSVGVCTSNTVIDGRRTQVWETDHPVKILNIVCGRWLEKRGDDTVVYYDPAHPYNVDEMVSTLDAARRWYSEWFLPYPWEELKLSEFPGLAGYAQGFGTNITFSENIGFLTRNTVQTDATFLVTAHETAHQWWGNILTPANGPNGDFLSEGTAHFSTLLLFEQVKGPRARMEFAKGIEDRYGKRRHANEERPMYDVDGKRRHDSTIIYDRGGWVFWMVYDFLGHERAIEAYRNFFRTWSTSRDHPALQDFVAAMRPWAEDPEAYDAFTREWFEEKVLPWYTVSDAKKIAEGDGYLVTCTVENVGTGTMPVEIAATAGERWQEPPEGEAGRAWTERPDFRQARATVILGAGESKVVQIRCEFDPERIVVDPDVRVLQLERRHAMATL